MNTEIKTIEGFYTRFYQIIMFICKILLVADIGITSVAVLGRYVPFMPDPAWSEEIVLTCMIYMALLSAALAVKRQAHIRMTALDRYLPEKLVRILDLFGDLVVLVFAGIMMSEGWSYAVRVGEKSMYTSLPWLSKFWLYVPVAFAGFAMILFELEAIYRHIRTMSGKGGKDEW